MSPRRISLVRPTRAPRPRRVRVADQIAPKRKGIVQQSVKDVNQVRFAVVGAAGRGGGRRGRRFGAQFERARARARVVRDGAGAQSLVDNDIVSQDKIGVGQYFWLFPSQAGNKVWCRPSPAVAVSVTARARTHVESRGAGAGRRRGAGG